MAYFKEQCRGCRNFRPSVYDGKTSGVNYCNKIAFFRSGLTRIKPSVYKEVVSFEESKNEYGITTKSIKISRNLHKKDFDIYMSADRVSRIPVDQLKKMLREGWFFQFNIDVKPTRNCVYHNYNTALVREFFETVPEIYNKETKEINKEKILELFPHIKNTILEQWVNDGCPLEDHVFQAPDNMIAIQQCPERIFPEKYSKDPTYNPCSMCRFFKNKIDNKILSPVEGYCMRNSQEVEKNGQTIKSIFSQNRKTYTLSGLTCESFEINKENDITEDKSSKLTRSLYQFAEICDIQDYDRELVFILNPMITKTQYLEEEDLNELREMVSNQLVKNSVQVIKAGKDKMYEDLKLTPVKQYFIQSMGNETRKEAQMYADVKETWDKSEDLYK